jgi:alpha-L-fucosidase
MLVDIVSRNGNLLLNFPLPGSGQLDDRELTVLFALTDWMSVNQDGIHGTRPWKINGDRPSSVPAFAMGWPAGEVTVKASGDEQPAATRQDP